LGATDYGAWSSALSLTAFSAFADLGLGAGLMTKLSAAIATGDLGRARRLVSSTYLSIVALVLALLVTLWASSTWIDYSRVIGGQAGRTALADIVLVALSISIANILGNLIVRTQYAAQQIPQSNIWQSAGSLASIGSAYLAAAMDTPATVFILLVSGTPLAFSIANTVQFFALGKGREFRPRLSDWHRGTLAEVLALGTGFLGINLLMVASLSTDNLVIGHAVGLDQVPEYAICARVFSFMAVVTYLFAGPLWPLNVEALTQGDTNWVNRTTLRMSMLSGGSATLLALAAVAVGPVFITTWVDSSVHPNRTLLAGLGIMLVFQAFASPVFMVLNAGEVLRPQMVGFALLLLAIPLKWIAASQHSVALVPWIGALMYVSLLAPCLRYGYRQVLSNSERSKIRSSLGGS